MIRSRSARYLIGAVPCRPEGQGEDTLVARLGKHTGPVRGLEFSELSPNLLASGADAGEICVWDLKNPNQLPHHPEAHTRHQLLQLPHHYLISSLLPNLQVGVKFTEN